MDALGEAQKRQAEIPQDPQEKEAQRPQKVRLELPVEARRWTAAEPAAQNDPCQSPGEARRQGWEDTERGPLPVFQRAGTDQQPREPGAQGSAQSEIGREIARGRGRVHQRHILEGGVQAPERGQRVRRKLPHHPPFLSNRGEDNVAQGVLEMYIGRPGAGVVRDLLPEDTADAVENLLQILGKELGFLLTDCRMNLRQVHGPQDMGPPTGIPVRHFQK